MKIRTPKYTTLVIIIGIFWAGLIAPATAPAAGKVVHRPISDFLLTQGTYCFGGGPCFLFVPPDPNFLGWSTDFDKPPVLFAGVDYAGLVTSYPGGGPTFKGSVTERPLADGRAQVKVSLQTSNANTWVIELDFSGDVLGQIAGSAPTLFGLRPGDVGTGAGQALADTLLEVTFINDAPGAPLPDLVQLVNFPGTLQELETLRFVAHATGPLTAAFGVAAGTPGRCTIVQTGLIAHLPAEDPYPAEMINCRVVGQ